MLEPMVDFEDFNLQRERHRRHLAGHLNGVHPSCFVGRYQPR